MEIPTWTRSLVEQIQGRKNGEDYICASGVSVSGVLHVGKLRDLFVAHSVNLALNKEGYRSQLVYFIDDFDKLKKRPKDLSEDFDKFVGMPYSLVPDPCGDHNSFVDHYLLGFLRSAGILGIRPDGVIQESKRYDDNFYSDQVKTVFDSREKIVGIVNAIRDGSKRKFDDSRLFVVYCPECNRDSPKNKRVKDDGKISYKCSCGFDGNIDVLDGSFVKLSWITNWPSRWKAEGTDFEPIGPDHAAPGGAFEVSSVIAREIFNIDPPIAQQYGFISLRGSGKLSSSGKAVSLEDFLSIYEPDLILDLFSSKRPESFFEISSGEDITSIYENYDKKNNLRLPSFSRVLSTLNRFLLDKSRTLEELSREGYQGEVSERVEKASNWITSFAPPEYRVQIQESPVFLNITNLERQALIQIVEMIDKVETEKEVENGVYRIINDFRLSPKEFFPSLYKIVLGTESGPKMGRVICENKQKFSSLVREVIEKTPL